MRFGKKALTSALVCWLLALVFGGCGAYCGVTDPFFTSEGIGSGISFWVAVAGLGVSFTLANLDYRSLHLNQDELTSLPGPKSPGTRPRHRG
jgi:hypothetical protein